MSPVRPASAVLRVPAMLLSVSAAARQGFNAHPHLHSQSHQEDIQVPLADTAVRDPHSHRLNHDWAFFQFTSNYCETC